MLCFFASWVFPPVTSKLWAPYLPSWNHETFMESSFNTRFLATRTFYSLTVESFMTEPEYPSMAVRREHFWTFRNQDTVTFKLFLSLMLQVRFYIIKSFFFSNLSYGLSWQLSELTARKTDIKALCIPFRTRLQTFWSLKFVTCSKSEGY